MAYQNIIEVKSIVGMSINNSFQQSTKQYVSPSTFVYSNKTNIFHILYVIKNIVLRYIMKLHYVALVKSELSSSQILEPLIYSIKLSTCIKTGLR